MTLKRTAFVRALPPTAHDLKLIGRLVDHARAAGRTPGRDPMPLTRAGDRAFKARLPLGHQGRDSVFLRLVLMARAWNAQPQAAREAKAPDLLSCAEICREILEAPPPDPVGLRSIPPGDR
jgi:hypothetical protein